MQVAKVPKLASQAVSQQHALLKQLAEWLKKLQSANCSRICSTLTCSMLVATTLVRVSHVSDHPLKNLT